uniref:Uncharacterized protein n=1 Tax=Arion vulgaris TaxID=1028688 RepID=A0A0B6YRG9_9EUPU
MVCNETIQWNNGSNAGVLLLLLYSLSDVNMDMYKESSTSHVVKIFKEIDYM